MEDILKQYGWKLDADRLQPVAYCKQVKTTHWKLAYNRHTAEWSLKQNGRTFFLGQEATENDIVDVIGDIEIVVTGCSK